MRLGAFCTMALALLWPAILSAQEYSANNTRATNSVLRPAATVAWRNYVTVPDGHCGCPMSVEADCYNGCPHRCNPIRFVRRVGRMLDCLLPCNLCCGGGLHGCQLGGRMRGHCSICCGTACSGGCGDCYGGATCGQGGCCPNPAGSVFDCVTPSCVCGGHCVGCGSNVGCSTTAPAMSDPFQDDPLPPIPTTQPATEVRREPAQRTRPVASGTGVRGQESGVRQPVARQAVVSKPMNSRPAASPASPSPYKIVNSRAATKPNAARPVNLPSAPKVAPAVNVERGSATRSVLRKVSVEDEPMEPAPLNVDRARAVPLVRTEAPSEVNYRAVPSNPLR